MTFEIEFKKVVSEVSKFINENVNEFEFVKDLNDVNNYTFDIEGKYIRIEECCIIYFKDIFENEIKNNLDEEVICKNIIINGVKLVIVS
jgi:hypothetical protein